MLWKVAASEQDVGCEHAGRRVGIEVGCLIRDAGDEGTGERKQERVREAEGIERHGVRGSSGAPVLLGRFAEEDRRNVDVEGLDDRGHG